MKKEKEKCNLCYGYGFWCWGHIAPMGPMDASDGVPTMPCPKCGANPNPVKKTDSLKKRTDEIKKLYGLE